MNLLIKTNLRQQRVNLGTKRFFGGLISPIFYFKTRGTEIWTNTEYSFQRTVSIHLSFRNLQRQ